MLLQRTEYDAKTKRAYVELRGRDGDAVATTIPPLRGFLFLSLKELV
jgi:hypothetical protein